MSPPPKSTSSQTRGEGGGKSKGSSQDRGGKGERKWKTQLRSFFLLAPSSAKDPYTCWDSIFNNFSASPSSTPIFPPSTSFSPFASSSSTSFSASCKERPNSEQFQQNATEDSNEAPPESNAPCKGRLKHFHEWLLLANVTGPVNDTIFLSNWSGSTGDIAKWDAGEGGGHSFGGGGEHFHQNGDKWEWYGVYLHEAQVV